jgi:gliding motility-associated-like protein
MKNNTLQLFLPIATILALFTPFCICAQAPANDECINAELIADPSDYCSPVEGELNFLATPSNVPNTTCLNQILNDVWYTFKAVAPQIKISVSGRTFAAFSGPSITLYSGDCASGLTVVGCDASAPFAQYQDLVLNNLVPGQIYYIRVDSWFQGFFQLCCRSGLLEDEITGDCGTATIICDKDTYFVPYVGGPGEVVDEWEGVECLLGFPGEFNSSWFVFTAATSGTLEFTLTPENPDDDLDFMVYHMPNGPNDCDARILERCMVAGTSDPTASCYGPTGLNTIATDISEPPGCDFGQDNFGKYMDLVAGESYMLSVNNFTSTGNGFTIDWGGTAQFEGPKIGFKTDDADNIICRGEEIIVTDTSVYAAGTIDAWKWTFGANASPALDTTQGPNTVQYLKPGLNTIKMLIRTNLGCFVKRSLDIRVDSCCALIASAILGPDCLPDTTCQQAAAIIENGIAPFQFAWSNGQKDSIATMLETGDYTLIVQDTVGCIDTFAFKVYIKGDFNIPNAFTPNGDQANDVFQPVSTDALIEVLQIQVWNRWGNLVHDGKNNGWDGNIKGEPAASDVYLYKIKIRLPEGDEEIMSGEVTLLR